jgi:hypothetical protein
VHSKVPLCAAVLLALCLAATGPTAAQSQVARTGSGGVAGQEFPTQQPVATGVVLLGGAVLAVVGAAIAMHASRDNGGASAASVTTVTTTTR